MADDKLTAASHHRPEGGFQNPWPDVRQHGFQDFLKWSLQALRKQIPPRDMHLSKRMGAEELALNYLCLRDEYGAGQLFIDRDDGE